MTSQNSRQTLIIPALGGLYARLNDGVETLLRVIAGGFLADALILPASSRERA